MQKNKSNTKNNMNISIKINELNDFPSLTSSNNRKNTLNKKWGIKNENDNIKNKILPTETITTNNNITIKNLQWKYTSPITTLICHVPSSNIIEYREVCGDDSDITANYTNMPYSEEMDNYLSDIWTEKFGVWGWYRECDQYDLYPTRESWIDMWEPDQIPFENGYPMYDTDSSCESDTDRDSPVKINLKYRTGFVCPTCNYDFPSKQRLAKHMRQTDHGDNDYEITTNNNDW
jgi:hypothetical protein